MANRKNVQASCAKKRRSIGKVCMLKQNAMTFLLPM
jgi:hypothetical protein